MQKFRVDDIVRIRNAKTLAKVLMPIQDQDGDWWYEVEAVKHGEVPAREMKQDDLELAYREYIDREIIRETEKAYLVKQEVNNRRGGWHTNFKWVAKRFCKPSELAGCVLVPEWIVSNGIW